MKVTRYSLFEMPGPNHLLRLILNSRDTISRNDTHRVRLLPPLLLTNFSKSVFVRIICGLSSATCDGGPIPTTSFLSSCTRSRAPSGRGFRVIWYSGTHVGGLGRKWLCIRAVGFGDVVCYAAVWVVKFCKVSLMVFMRLVEWGF
jgi:hypothetical protein